MTTVNMLEAKTRLSQLVRRVESGEEVIIARDGKPVARLVPLAARPRRRPGTFRGKVWLTDAFFEPLPEDELCAWEGEAPGS